MLLVTGDGRGAAREERLGDNTLEMAQQFSDVSAKRIRLLFTGTRTQLDSKLGQKRNLEDARRHLES